MFEYDQISPEAFEHLADVWRELQKLACAVEEKRHYKILSANRRRALDIVEAFLKDSLTGNTPGIDLVDMIEVGLDEVLK